MLILHNPVTLKHRTKEVVGSELIDSHECPERIEAILAAIRADTVTDPDTSESRPHHVLHDVTNSPEYTKGKIQELTRGYIEATHDAGYLTHLSTIFSRAQLLGKVKEDGCLLPECFRILKPASGIRVGEEPEDIIAKLGYYAFDMSSGISKETHMSILASAMLAVEGIWWILHGIYPYKEDTNDKTRPLNEGGGRTVMSLCRPPGHHCDGKMSGGYCYINNVVVAVQALDDLHRSVALNGYGGVKDPKPRVAILDIDYHHGNGTQDYFWSSDRVLYVSVHGNEEYPYYSGNVAEFGNPAAGVDGYGSNFNHPLPRHTDVRSYLNILEGCCMDIRGFSPQYLIISLGLDTYHLDPLGSFDIDTEHYRLIGGRIRSRLRKIPCLIVLEGGYVVEKLGPNLLSFLTGWEQAERHGVWFEYGDYGTPLRGVT